MADPQFEGMDIKDLEPSDLLEIMYGAIRDVVEVGNPDNVIMNYFMPPVPFGKELGTFMDLGSRPKPIDAEGGDGEPSFTVNDMARAAVNFAVIVDYVPTLDRNPVVDLGGDGGETVDLNSLISSGKTVSALYQSILDNCRVVNNDLSDEDKARLAKLRAVLYVEAPETSDEPESEELAADDLLDALGDEEDIDLDALLGDGLDAADFVDNPDDLSPPTKVMKLYQATQNLYNQVEATELDKISGISANDPNGQVRIRASKRNIAAAMRRWELQGKKEQVEKIQARIGTLERGGMPLYLDRLKRRYAGNLLSASVFAGDEGLSLLTEEARYTALRPNGILSAPSLLTITISSSSADEWTRMRSSKTSGSGSAFPFVGFKASGSKEHKDAAADFCSESFTISFEIVQGIVDRPWLDVAFLESRAYTTMDMDTKKSLDAMVPEITMLSDGEIPPKQGHLAAIPMSAYFVRNMVVQSKALARMSKSASDSISGGAGVSFMGWGAEAAHSSTKTEAQLGSDSTEGELRLSGQFLVALGSRFLGKAPDPDMETFPNASDWI